MKTCVGNPLLLTALAAGLASALLPAQVGAQTFTTLHSFGWTIANSRGNYDGIWPHSALAVSGAVLYGTTYFGGTNAEGVVFKVNTDGTGFTTLHNCADTSGEIEELGASLVQSGSTLFGTSYYFGTGNGTVFKINTNGTGLALLHSFTQMTFSSTYGQYVNSDGALPNDPLVLSSSTLYGVAPQGGTYGLGTVFKVGTGGGFTVLRSITPSDGGGPVHGALVVSGSTLFGVVGTNIFSMNSAGTGFRVPFGSNIVSGALTLSGSTLYWLSDAVYSINTNGTGLMLLHSITNHGSLLRGESPKLVISGNTLYGTVPSRTGLDNGMVFAMNTDGTGFTILHNFTATDPVLGTNVDGAVPNGLVLSGNILYGTAAGGGAYGNGTIFSISLPVVQPQLTITPAGSNAILTWPITPVGFTLQSTTNLAPPIVWTTNSPAPVFVNGQNTVTNPISGTRQFYRLGQ